MSPQRRRGSRAHDTFVLDAFALISLFANESTAARVEGLLERATDGRCRLAISTVNLGEVMYTIERRRGRATAADALRRVEQLPVRVVPADINLALEAARLKAESGMGYLDCFVAALARQLDAAVVTGDPDFKEVEGVVAVEWLAADSP